MIIFLYGPDTFRSRRYLKLSIEQFKKQRDPAGYNTKIMDAKKNDGGKIFSEISAAPFLAEKRLVVIENVLSIKDGELLSALANKIQDEKISPATVLIFWQGEPTGRLKAAKELETILKKEKYAQEFSPLSGTALSTWIEKEVESHGCKISAEASEYLTRQAGGDLWSLSPLINQLCAYVGNSPSAVVQLADALLFLDEKIDDNVFSMVEAVVAGDHKRAFTLLGEQRRLGQEEGQLFGLLVWQFRILLELADVLHHEPGITSDIAAKKLKIHPFVARKNFATAKKYSLAKLQDLYQELLAIDIQTKTGAAPQSLLVDSFVAKI